MCSEHGTEFIHRLSVGGLFAKQLLQHYHISTCLWVERKVQGLISQIWKHEVVALKAVPLKCNYSVGAIVETHFTGGIQSGGAVKGVGNVEELIRADRRKKIERMLRDK